MGPVLLVSAALAQESSSDVFEVYESPRFDSSWSESIVVTIVGTIREVRETLGSTSWDVAVTEQIGGSTLPTVLSVVQPRGCLLDGERQTSFNGVVNTQLTAGTNVVITFTRQPRPTPNVGLGEAMLYFPHEGVTVQGRAPIRGLDCAKGPVGSDRPELTFTHTVQAHEAGLLSVYLLPAARVGMMPWSDFLTAIRACVTS